MTRNPIAEIKWYHCAFIAGLITFAFANSLRNGFVWDDIDLIVNNPLTANLANIPHIFLSEDKTSPLIPTGYYRPMAYVTFAFERAIWGLNPLGFTITNLCLHILAALLFYQVVLQVLRNNLGALCAALFFALHPITVETINFHSARSTLLCACFSLLSLMFYSRRQQVPALIFFVAGIFSKEFALLLPAVFIMHDLVIRSEKIRWQTILPYFIAITCYLGIRSVVVEKHSNLLGSLNLWANVPLIPRIIAGYFQNMLFPLNLKTMYGISAVMNISLVFAYTLLGGMLATAIIFRKRIEVTISVFIFLLFLLPVSSIFPMGIIKMADRHAYFSLFGFSIGIGYCLSILPRKVAFVIISAVSLVFTVIDRRQSTIWRDDFSLFSRMIKDAPEMSIGHLSLGYAYLDKGDNANAEKYFTEALLRNDMNPTLLTGATLAFWGMQRFDKALTALSRKIEMAPGDPHSYVMASRILGDMGDKTRADYFRHKAQALDPDIYKTLRSKAVNISREAEKLLARHELPAAEKLFLEALQIDPDFVTGIIGLGRVEIEKGNLTLALERFIEAQEVAPSEPSVYHHLSIVYHRMGMEAPSKDNLDKFRQLNTER